MLEAVQAQREAGSASLLDENLARGQVLTAELGVRNARLAAANSKRALARQLGVWLHLTEQHRHVHTHESLEHEHEHVHDAHHQHEHEAQVPPGTKHRHWHRHEPLTHDHAHFPDAHHRHFH